MPLKKFTRRNGHFHLPGCWKIFQQCVICQWWVDNTYFPATI